MRARLWPEVSGMPAFLVKLVYLSRALSSSSDPLSEVGVEGARTQIPQRRKLRL
jgi:hypothetical protein